MKKIMFIFLFIAIVFTTIVYSAFSTQLQISGEAIVRSDNDIRITNIKVLSQSNGAYETYNNKYTKDTTSMFITLPSNSSIILEVEVNNRSNNDYSLTDIQELNNSNINVSYSLNTHKYDIYKANKITTFKIELNNSNVEEQKETLLLKFIFDRVNATFISGSSFNSKIKKLAGNNDASYSTRDENIKRIIRTDVLTITPTDENVVSTYDSTVPIYAWYDSDIIYYYTNAVSPYINSNSRFMFRYLTKVIDIDLDNVSTSKATDIADLFAYNFEMENVNVSSFDTSNVTNMQGVFFQDYKLKELDLSNWNTSKVKTMYSMLRYCNNLESIDLSSFDMSAITANNYIEGMIEVMNSLEELKTPKIYPNNLSITLPKTLYDENNNSYTILDSTSPTQTWLRVNN